MDITTQDYMYIECIGLVLSYYRLSEEEREEYYEVASAALDIATSRNSLSIEVFHELMAQEAIALQIGEGTRIQPNDHMYTTLDTILTYAGDMDVNIMLNIDYTDCCLVIAQLSDILRILE